MTPNKEGKILPIRTFTWPALSRFIGNLKMYEVGAFLFEIGYFIIESTVWVRSDQRTGLFLILKTYSRLPDYL